MDRLKEAYEWFDKRITIEDPVNFMTYMKLKGIERIKKSYHILLPHIEEITDKDMRDIYKYDLRLRRDIYYYITMFEVYLRAQLSNHYDKNRFNLNKYDLHSHHSLDEILENSTFGKLVHMYEDLSIEEIEQLTEIELPKYELIERMRAVKNLRNAVFHHNFLLDYEDYAHCEIEGIHVCSLMSNLMNFYMMLPKELQTRFVVRINKTDQGLDIPKELIVRLSFT